MIRANKIGTNIYWTKMQQTLQDFEDLEELVGDGSIIMIANSVEDLETQLDTEDLNEYINLIEV